MVGLTLVLDELVLVVMGLTLVLELKFLVVVKKVVVFTGVMLGKVVRVGDGVFVEVVEIPAGVVLVLDVDGVE